MKNCRLKHMAWKVCEYVEGVGEYLYVSSLMHPYIKKKTNDSSNQATDSLIFKNLPYCYCHWAFFAEE